MKYIGWVILGVVAIGVIWILTGYNSIVTLDQKTLATWAEVENQYQRRSDLVPNLEEIVKGAASFEQETFTAVTEARVKAQASTVKVDESNLTPEAIREFQSTQGEFGAALSRLLLVVENYPALKATDAFRDFQIQLEGTENRISVARRDFTLAVEAYNARIKQFPGNVTAMLFGFAEKGYFESVVGSETAPKVDF